MDTLCLTGVNATWATPGSMLARDECLVDLISIIPHMLLLLIATPLLYCMNRREHQDYDIGDWYGNAWPHFIGHEIRYSLAVVLAFVNIIDICEGILAQSLQESAQAHLYVPHCISLLASIVTLVYYHHAETNNKSPYLIVLLIYWALALGVKIWKGIVLSSIGLHTEHLRFLLTWLVVAVYSGLLIVEVCTVIKQFIKPAQVYNEVTGSRFIHDYTNLLSRATFWWVNRILLLGYLRPLEMADLGSLPKNELCERLTGSLQQAFEDEDSGCCKRVKKSLLRSFMKCFLPTMAIGFVFKLAADTLPFFAPYAIGRIIEFLEKNGSAIDMNNVTMLNGNVYIGLSDFLSNGYVLGLLLTLSGVVQSALSNWSMYMCIVSGIRCRVALMGMIYKKSLKLPSWAMTGASASLGRMINLLAVDTMLVMFSFFMFLLLLAMPFQFVIAIVVLYNLLGYSVLIGAAWILLILPIVYKITVLMAKYKTQQLKVADERIKKSNDLLQGIKLLKLCAWTELFRASVCETRKKEIRCMMKNQLLSSLSTFLTESGPIFILLTAILMYPLLNDEPMTSSKTLSALSLIAILNKPFNLFSYTFKMIVDGYLSTKRIQEFLNIQVPETNGKTISHERENGSAHGIELRALETNEALKITEGYFRWGDDEDIVCLKDINLNVVKGEFVMVIGEVGSGKSSLLSAMLNEMLHVSGTIEWSNNTTVSYAAQIPWLLNATLKDNILFGKEFDEERYAEVIAACGLKPDIDVLVAGDLTEIGQKGINLSGGQKHRVSMARAFYSDANVVLLDDPLSALDSHTGRHVFKEGLINLLAERKRTVVLVTHMLQYISRADKIVVMSGGRIKNQGNLEKLNQDDPLLFTHSWLAPADQQSESSSDHEDSECIEVAGNKRLIGRGETTRIAKIDDVKRGQTEDMEKTPKTGGVEAKEKDKQERGKLIEKEEREKGAISRDVYIAYIKACSTVLVCLVLLSFVLQQALLTGKDYWLSFWTDASEKESFNANGTYTEDDEELAFYMGWFAGLSIGGVLLTFVSTFATYVVTIKGANTLHLNLLKRIVHAPLRFFDVTPVGRILNRFSSDTSMIDQRMPATTRALLSVMFPCLSAVVVSSISSPFVLIGVVAIGVVFFFLQRFFRTSSRELQRLENIYKSPIFSHFSETLGGLATIRAYGHTDRFTKNMFEHVDTSNAATLMINTANRWLGIRLDYLGALFTFCATLAGILAGVYLEAPPGFVGLAIIYTLSVSYLLTYVIRQVADYELHANSVERIMHYIKTENEPQTMHNMVPVKVADEWPINGKVEFRNTSLRYAEHLPVVVRDLTTVIEGGTKVGICGRTGSGKSSITLGLFRMIDLCAGNILIDDVDIGRVALDKLRSSLSIIPQDPTLFMGSIRSNLDPANVTTDEQLWEALEIAQLKEVVKRLNGDLDAQISEGGSNLSGGQRQLFCLARAFLRQSKILVMDEATASIDFETDDLIQDVIKKVFKGSTLIIVAHRISTIFNCDKIIVMDDGQLMETGTPSDLVKEDSLFSQLVKAQGSL